MEISTVDLKRCTLIRLDGRFDGSVALEFGSKLMEITDSGRYKIVINMAEVSYISSPCLQKLIATWKTCRRWDRGNIRFAELSPIVARALDLTGLNTQFEIFAKEAEAVGSF